jgi:hypothetical protein
MASPLPAKPKRTELDFRLSFKKYDEIGETVRTALKWVSLVLIVRYGYLPTWYFYGRPTENLGLGEAVGRQKVPNQVDKTVHLLPTGHGGSCTGIAGT